MSAVEWGGIAKGELTAVALTKNRVIAARLGFLDQVGMTILQSGKASVTPNSPYVGDKLSDDINPKSGLHRTRYHLGESGVDADANEFVENGFVWRAAVGHGEKAPCSGLLSKVKIVRFWLDEWHGTAFKRSDRRPRNRGDC
jgi:hypothetical protein